MALIHVSKDPSEHAAISLGHGPLSTTKVNPLFILNRPARLMRALKKHKRFFEQETRNPIFKLSHHDPGVTTNHESIAYMES